MKRLLILLPLAVVLSGCNDPVGFNDPDALAKSLGTAYNSLPVVLENPRLITTNVQCVQSGAHAFDCRFATADGAHLRTYIVSADGTSWLPKADQ